MHQGDAHFYVRVPAIHRCKSALSDLPLVICPCCHWQTENFKWQDGFPCFEHTPVGFRLFQSILIQIQVPVPSDIRSSYNNLFLEYTKQKTFLCSYFFSDDTKKRFDVLPSTTLIAGRLYESRLSFMCRAGKVRAIKPSVYCKCTIAAHLDYGWLFFQMNKETEQLNLPFTVPFILTCRPQTQMSGPNCLIMQT